jgi:hypothetical protein
MNVLMSIIFFIMFLVIIGVMIYLIYNYIEYKNSVNKIIEQQNGFNSNLNADIRTVDNKYSPLINNVNENVGKLDTKLNSYSTKIDSTSNTILNFDTALNQFFLFTSNNLPISDRIYNHFFKPDTLDAYRIKMMRRVEAVSGMTIDTDIINDFKICKAGDRNKCITMRTNDNGFDIKPAGADNINFFNKNNRPLAQFDLNRDTVHMGGYSNQTLYFGGVHGIRDSHAMKIEGSNMYVDADTFFVSSKKLKPASIETFTNYEHFASEPPQYSLRQIFDELNESTIDTKNDLSEDIDTVDGNLNQLSTITETIIDDKVKIFAQYMIQNNMMNNPENNQMARRNYLRFKILPLADIKSGETIKIIIPKTEIGNIVKTTPATQSINISGIPPIHYPITSDANNVTLEIRIPMAPDGTQTVFIQKNTIISVAFMDFEWITGMTDSFNSGIITGSIIPQVITYPAPSIPTGEIMDIEAFMKLISNLNIDPKLTESFISYA